MLSRLLLSAVLFLGPIVPGAVRATQPSPEELAQARRWSAAKFEGRSDAPARQVGLVVLANHDPVQQNARAGRPLRMGDRQFSGGLYCHAPSNVQVHLPKPGSRLTATVGVDSNEQTGGGRGSVVFLVRVGDREVFRSALLREGMAPVAIDVDLAGATDFSLEVTDGGDGISCDQADWADAQVTLADGGTVALGALSLTAEPPVAFTSEPPFSFTFGGKPSNELLPEWKCTRVQRPIDDARVEHTVTYTDPGSGLEARCVAVEYRDFPTVEWTLHLRNGGSADSPILENVLAIDAAFPARASHPAVLHHQVGSPCQANDYEPLTTLLEAGKPFRVAAAGGRPTNTDLPYFNLESGGEGTIVVVGWPGQWAAEMTRQGDSTVRVRAGQELTHFALHPGEEVRTPLAVVQFWQGDRVRSQNIWRRWMLAHNVPRQGEELPGVQMAACSSHQFGEMIHADTENQIQFIDRYLEEKFPLDYWWMDAGWYPNRTGWPNTGTWEVDTERFPGGLKPICDHAHQRGVRTIVWFEPERVTAGTWLTENHPEWILGGREGGLLNLGNPEAWKWLVEHVDGLITQQGIDLYRQDFNMDPLAYWRAADAPDRQGITEIRHVEGYLAYWDALRKRHPQMLIDSCASGGRRNDLETLRRAVPLLRSDYIVEPVGNQGHTWGIALWMPFYGTGTGSGELSPYLIRSVLCPHFTACFDVRRDDLDYPMLRRVLGEWREYGQDFLGDYYPLTPYSLKTDVWMAWQFDRPENGRGVVQAFRRPDSVYEAARFKLRGLDPAARYQVRDLDAGTTQEAAGQDLMEKGLLVGIADSPGSAVVVYHKVAVSR